VCKCNTCRLCYVFAVSVAAVRMFLVTRPCEVHVLVRVHDLCGVCRWSVR